MAQEILSGTRPGEGGVRTSGPFAVIFQAEGRGQKKGEAGIRNPEDGGGGVRD